MELTPEQLAEIEAYCNTRIHHDYKSQPVAGFGTQHHAMLALLADNRAHAARIAELETEIARLRQPGNTYSICHDCGDAKNADEGFMSLTGFLCRDCWHKSEKSRFAAYNQTRGTNDVTT